MIMRTTARALATLGLATLAAGCTPAAQHQSGSGRRRSAR